MKENELNSLKEIHRKAAKRHGGGKSLEELLPRPKSRAALRRIPDQRYLSTMAQIIFSMGFVWRVVEAKWPGFEEAFKAFDPAKVARLSVKQLDALTKDTRIIRNPQKIDAVHENARWLVALAKEHGSASRFFADWPEDDIVGLWDVMKRDGTRLGGMTGPMFLRHMGKDTPMLTDDVLKALRREKVITSSSASSKRAHAAIQGAFNTWRDESGRSLSEISRILACSV